MGCTSSTGSTPADNRTGRSFPSSKPSNAASRSRNCWPMPGTNSVSTAAEDRPSRIPNATSSGMRKPRPRSSAPDARRIRLPRAPNATVAWSISGSTSDVCITPARRKKPKPPRPSRRPWKAGMPLPRARPWKSHPDADPAAPGSTRSRRLPGAGQAGRQKSERQPWKPGENPADRQKARRPQRHGTPANRSKTHRPRARANPEDRLGKQ